MRRLTTSRMLAAGVAVAAAALVGLSAGPSGPVAEAATQPAHLTTASPVTVVASGLNSPRSLTWGPHGHMYASEMGGSPPTCRGAGFETRCFGFTGSIADITAGTRVATGLASSFNEEEVVGPNGLAYADGHFYALESGAPQLVPDDLPQAAALKYQYGALLKVKGQHVSSVLNVGDLDYRWADAHQDLVLPGDFPNANPYALVDKPGGGFYLVDAGANLLESVDRHGNLHLLTFVPTKPNGTDSVPTCLSVGPDGAVYLGEMTGHGNSATAADIYRYSPTTGSLTVWQSGFSAISGCGFGANGDFYVTELDTTGFLPTGDPDGVVIQIDHENNARTVLGEGKLFAPTGFLAGPDGSVYVANKTMMWPACTDAPACTSSSVVTANDGEIVKIG